MIKPVMHLVDHSSFCGKLHYRVSVLAGEGRREKREGRREEETG